GLGRSRLVHSVHRWVTVYVKREHGVALLYFAGFPADPGIPQTGQPPGRTVGAPKPPPHIAAAFPTRFIEGFRRNDAALPPRPRLPECRFPGQLFSACIVGGIGQLGTLGERGDQRPLTHSDFPALVTGTNE